MSDPPPSVAPPRPLEVVESLGADTVSSCPTSIWRNMWSAHTKVKIISWHGACEVALALTADELRHYARGDPSLRSSRHPNAPPYVLSRCD